MSNLKFPQKCNNKWELSNFTSAEATSTGSYITVDWNVIQVKFICLHTTQMASIHYNYYCDSNYVQTMTQNYCGFLWSKTKQKNKLLPEP